MTKQMNKAQEILAKRKQDYNLTFTKESLAVVAVLEDLAKFCRAHESTFHEDPRLHAVLEGRREVWLRIQNHLQLSDDELWKLYGA